MDLKKQTWKAVDGRSDTFLGRCFPVAILGLILLNVLAVILESVESIHRDFGRAFEIFETFSVLVFTIEYVIRAWSCVADDRYRGSIGGRLRFVVTPMAIIDLLAIRAF